MKIMSYNVLADKWVIKDRYGFIIDKEIGKLKKNISEIIEKIIEYKFFIIDKENVLDWNNRLERILNKIKTNDPDIICLQEVELEHIQKNFIDQLKNYDNIHHTIWKKGDNGYKRTNDIGNVTFWKKDKLNCITNTFNSCAVFTEFDKFMLINVHLAAGLRSSAETRVNQIKSCLKKIKELPICICGDFNEELADNSLVKIYLNQHHFNISNKQTTCNVYSYNTTYYYAFDHVVTYKINNVIVNPCTITEPIPNINEPSDHYPLIFWIPIPIY